MKAFIYISLIFAVIFLLSTVVMGQPGFPGGASGPAQAPIDGGLSLLAAAGGGYAFKKLRDRKKVDSDQ